MTVDIHGPLLGESLAMPPTSQLMFTDLLSLLDLPYDNDTHENGQKVCEDYLFVCSSDHQDGDECPYEVR